MEDRKIRFLGSSPGSTSNRPVLSLSWSPFREAGEREKTKLSWIIEKARDFQINIYFCLIDYTKACDCVEHNKLENSERDGNTRPPDLPLEKPVYRSGSNS